MSDSAATDLAERGYGVVEDVIPAADIPALRDRIAAGILANSRTPPPRGAVSNLLRVNQDLAPYLADARVGAVIEQTLGPKYRLSFNTGYVTPPGWSREEWHADWPHNQRPNMHVPAPYPDITMHLVTFWMLTDFRVDNGATLIVPGSHLRTDYPRPGSPYGDDNLAPQADETNLVGKAGSVAICDSRLWHAIAPNVSQDTRVTVVVRFAPWWLNLNTTRPSSVEYDTTYENSKIEDLPVDIYERLPESVRPLVHHLLPPGAQTA